MIVLFILITAFIGFLLVRAYVFQGLDVLQRLAQEIPGATFVPRRKEALYKTKAGYRKYEFFWRGGIQAQYQGYQVALYKRNSKVTEQTEARRSQKYLSNLAISVTLRNPVNTYAGVKHGQGLKSLYFIKTMMALEEPGPDGLVVFGDHSKLNFLYGFSPLEALKGLSHFSLEILPSEASSTILYTFNWDRSTKNVENWLLRLDQVIKIAIAVDERSKNEQS